jgi:hypothetical protein
MLGASDEELLQNAVSMDLQAERQADQILVTVSITNDQTGHHIPTDSPLRHLILLVNAYGPDGEALSQMDGSTIPDWGGVGNPHDGYYAGLPGKAYAKVLKELWTEVSPTGAYWNPTQVVNDNRLAAFETDTSSYTFAAPATGNITAEAHLLFRRAYIELMNQKGWDVPDILMEEEIERIP